MGFLNSYAPYSLLAALVLVAAVRRRLAKAKQLPYPPGPKPDFLIGNARQIPSHSSWLQYTEWRKTFGDVMHLEALGNHILILGSYEKAHEVLDMRAAYSDRPNSPMLCDLMGWSRAITNHPYNDKWKRCRKLMQGSMNKDIMKQYFPALEKDSRSYLLQLLDSPDHFFEHTRLLMGRVIIMFTYGIKVETSEDELIAVTEEAIDQAIAVAYPGATFVDTFPILKYVPSWFPGAQFKRNAKMWKKTTDRMFDDPFNRIKDEMAAGTAIPSFTSTLLDEGTFLESDIIDSAGTMYIAASDTTTSSLLSFFLAMAMFPEVQKKAQAEVDKVLRDNRLPSFEDREGMPYIEMLLKELQRWIPATPLSLPHLLMEDDYLDGYLVPKGTIAFPNIWAITRDEANYHEPLEFKPERFAGEKAELDPDHYAFGFGRRLCAGQNFADATIFIVIVSVLAMFDIGAAYDDAGKEIVVGDVPVTTGLICRPEHFRCSIRPRSAAAAATVRQTVETQV